MSLGPRRPVGWAAPTGVRQPPGREGPGRTAPADLGLRPAAPSEVGTGGAPHSPRHHAASPGREHGEPQALEVVPAAAGAGGRSAAQPLPADSALRGLPLPAPRNPAMLRGPCPHLRTSGRREGPGTELGRGGAGSCPQGQGSLGSCPSLGLWGRQPQRRAEEGGGRREEVTG